MFLIRSEPLELIKVIDIVKQHDSIIYGKRA